MEDVEVDQLLRSEDDRFLIGISSQDPSKVTSQGLSGDEESAEEDLRSDDNSYLIAAGIAVSQSLLNIVQSQGDSTKDQALVGSQDGDGQSYECNHQVH